MDARLQREIEHGRYLAKHGAGEVWNWEGPAGQARWMRRARMLSQGVGKGMNVLELGCGTAYLTRELAATGATITAIDISPVLLETARQNCPAENVTFEIQNACALSYPDNRFDFVVGSAVLHHLQIDCALRQIFRVVKSAGAIRFTEPNMLNPQIALQKNVPPIKKRLGDSPDETAFFRWKLFRMLEHAGFRDVRIQPFDFLHPKTPAAWIPAVETFGRQLERVPMLREIAGSLFIRALK